MQTLQDNFSVNDLPTLWGNSYGGQSVSGGQCELPCTTSYSQVGSTNAYDLTNSYAYCKMTPDQGGAGYECDLALSTDGYGQTGYLLGYESGDLKAQTVISGVFTGVGSTAYDPVAHAWLRIRESGGTVYYDTAPDGKTWTNQWTSGEPTLITALYAGVYTGYYSAGSDGISYVDNFNVIELTLVTTTTGSWSSPVGPQSVSPGNTAGNLLVASMTLVAASVIPFTTQIVPAFSICDSVGNWWRLAGDTGGSNGQVQRVAVWICDSALAIPESGWLSVAAAGYVDVLDCVIAEYSGLPAGYEPVIDFAVPYANNSTTTISLNAVASQADYCFSSARGLTLVPTAPGSPFTTAATIGGLRASYATVAAGASVNGSFTLASANPGAGVLVGISTAAYPPSNGNPNYPVVRVEAAFGATPGDSTQAIMDTSWVDITQRAIANEDVAGITVTRGRQYELATPEAGEVTVMLNNVDGAFNPVWPGSAYYSNALNSNMSFQSGVTPWAYHSSSGAATGTLSQSTAYTFASGKSATATYSLELAISSGTAVSPGITSGGVPVSVNSSYTGSAWFYLASGSASAQIGINWYGTSGSLISGSSGSILAVSSGTWTQVSLTATPPTGAVAAQLIPQLAGTISSAVNVYLAEAALSAGTVTTLTGLVRLQTPIRVSAWWQGQRYPVAYGYVERWPQTWPQLPQWGFSPMIATDVVGITNAVNLPSAVQGEILADNAYVCFPFNEQYQTSASTLNGVVATASNANGLIAVNTSRVNQQTANYLSGDEAVETGQTISLNGDSGTGMGVTGYSSIAAPGFRGGGAVYGPDTGLPVIGQSAGALVDFWVTVPSVVNTSGTQQYVPLMQFFGKPYISSIGLANLAPGWLMTAGVYFPSGSAGTAIMFLEYSQGTISVGSSAPFPLDASCYITLDIQPSGSVTAALNGTSTTFTVPLLNGPLEAVTFGQACYSYGSAFSRWNYSLAYGSVYSYEVPVARYQSHYTAGSTGFSGDTIMQRFGRYQAWAQLNVNPAGPGSIADAFQLSAAYSTDGSSFASALNADAQSAGAMWFGNANGNLVVVPRPATYRQPVSLIFGDNPIAILNASPDFSQNAAGWAASTGTLTVVTAQPAGSLYPFAALFTLSGSSGGIAESGAPFSATAGAEYSAGAWVYTSQTAVSLSITWLNFSGGTISSSSSSVTVQASTWTYASFSATAPAGTTHAYPFIGITGSSGNAIYIEHATVVNPNGEISYEASLGLDYDNTYIQNVTQATLVQGANSLVAPIEKSLQSIYEYLARGPQGVSVNGASAQDAYDVAYWYLNKYSQPQLRVSTVVVQAAENPILFTQILQADLSDVATLNRRPIGAPPYSLPVITEQVSFSIGPGVWDASYQLSPYVQEGDVLVTDVSGQDTLGTGTLAW
jgi:hypothetical protein